MIAASIDVQINTIPSLHKLTNREKKSSVENKNIYKLAKPKKNVPYVIAQLFFKTDAFKVSVLKSNSFTMAFKFYRTRSITY